MRISKQQAIDELFLNIEKQGGENFMDRMMFLLDCWGILNYIVEDIMK